jgi:hypothetical protein
MGELMKTCQTYWAKIFVGFRSKYEDTPDFIMEGRRDRLEGMCKGYCDEVGLCVTITDTTFIYKDGNEPGAIIGLMNYPRFPEEKGLRMEDTKIRKHSMKLAEYLMVAMNQYRVSIMYPDETVMLENEEL